MTCEEVCQKLKLYPHVVVVCCDALAVRVVYIKTDR